jgi:hypothetical protein
MAAMVSSAWVGSTPQDRLTRIAERVVQMLHDDPELEPGDRVLVIACSGEDTGIGGHGYSHTEGFLDLMVADAATATQGLMMAGGKLPDG